MLKNIATQKQINAIAFIEKQCEVTFNGSTKEEVYSFIGKYLPDAKMLQSLENLVSMPVYKATFSQRDKEGYEEINFCDSIAKQKFKNDIIKNKEPISAIADFAENIFTEKINK
jgi:hypothetical protein